MNKSSHIAAVNDVKPSTVISCFRKAGFPCEPSEDNAEDNITLSQLIRIG